MLDKTIDDELMCVYIYVLQILITKENIAFS